MQNVTAKICSEKYKAWIEIATVMMALSTSQLGIHFKHNPKTFDICRTLVILKRENIVANGKKSVAHTYNRLWKHHSILVNVKVH